MPPRSPACSTNPRATSEQAGSLLGRAREWRSARRTRARLLRLDDRTLADIGLSRADLDPFEETPKRAAEDFGRP